MDASPNVLITSALSSAAEPSENQGIYLLLQDLMLGSGLSQPFHTCHEGFSDQRCHTHCQLAREFLGNLLMPSDQENKGPWRSVLSWPQFARRSCSSNS